MTTMPKKAMSLRDIQRQIADLKVQEQQLKTQEKDGVVSRIKEAIAVYDLTRADLFGAQRTGALQSGGIRKNIKPKPSADVAKYSDGNGKVWGGRGPRPAWLRDALASGKALEDFLPGAGASADVQGGMAAESGDAAPQAAVPTAKKSARKTAKRSAKPVAAKYTDGAGKTWSGRGMQPVWLRTAIASGKALQDFAI